MTDDQLMPLTKAVLAFYGLQRSNSTCLLWATKGCRAINGKMVVLKSHKVGRQHMTTLANVREFDAAINTPLKIPAVKKPATTKQQQKDSEKLHKLLGIQS